MRLEMPFRFWRLKVAYSDVRQSNPRGPVTRNLSGQQRHDSAIA
jgi:hypothetical protein